MFWMFSLITTQIINIVILHSQLRIWGLFDGQAAAEEKFKHCSAAYKTLYDSFAAA